MFCTIICIVMSSIETDGMTGLLCRLCSRGSLSATRLSVTPGVSAAARCARSSRYLTWMYSTCKNRQQHYAQCCLTLQAGQTGETLSLILPLLLESFYSTPYTCSYCRVRQVHVYTVNDFRNGARVLYSAVYSRSCLQSDTQIYSHVAW